MSPPRRSGKDQEQAGEKEVAQALESWPLRRNMRGRHGWFEGKNVAYDRCPEAPPDGQ